MPLVICPCCCDCSGAASLLPPHMPPMLSDAYMMSMARYAPLHPLKELMIDAPCSLTLLLLLPLTKLYI